MSNFYCKWHNKVENANKRGCHEVYDSDENCNVYMCNEGLEEYAYKVYAAYLKKNSKNKRVSSK